MKFRHEYKFILTYDEYLLLHSRLNSIMEHDNNVDENGEYKIRSLYFDNLYDKVLKEKINNLCNKVIGKIMVIIIKCQIL